MTQNVLFGQYFNTPFGVVGQYNETNHFVLFKSLSNMKLDIWLEAHNYYRWWLLCYPAINSVRLVLHSDLTVYTYSCLALGGFTTRTTIDHNYKYEVIRGVSRIVFREVNISRKKRKKNTWTLQVQWRFTPEKLITFDPFGTESALWSFWLIFFIFLNFPFSFFTIFFFLGGGAFLHPEYGPGSHSVMYTLMQTKFWEFCNQANYNFSVRFLTTCSWHLTIICLPLEGFSLITIWLPHVRLSHSEKFALSLPIRHSEMKVEIFSIFQQNYCFIFSRTILLCVFFQGSGFFLMLYVTHITLHECFFQFHLLFPFKGILGDLLISAPSLYIFLNNFSIVDIIDRTL